MNTRLLDLCCFWAGILGLSHWTFRVRYAEKDKIPSNSDAHVVYKLCQEKALILIQKSEDSDAVEGFELDEEESLVHELLHLVFGMVNVPRNANLCFDQAIDRVARGLVRLKREKELALG